MFLLFSRPFFVSFVFLLLFLYWPCFTILREKKGGVGKRSEMGGCHNNEIKNSKYSLIRFRFGGINKRLRSSLLLQTKLNIEQYHRPGEEFHLNGHAVGFGPQTQ